MLRSAALKIIRALGIEGGCNIQFALAPRREIAAWDARRRRPPAVLRHRGEPARLPLAPRSPRRRPATRSRASPPRSPSARRSTRSRTPSRGKTTAAFEPALDYCVVKIPRWPFDKFPLGDRRIGTQMKATGEVMAIDRTLRGGAAEGRPLASRSAAARCSGRTPPGSDDPTRATTCDADGRAPLGGHRGAAPRRDADGAVAAHRHRPVVPRPAAEHRRAWSSACSPSR